MASAGRIIIATRERNGMNQHPDESMQPDFSGPAIDPAPGIDTLYAAVPERNTADVMLRTTQQHHVALSTMADTKANIIITVSSIVLTLSLGRLDHVALRTSMLVLAGFTLLTLLLAILAVLPKYRPLRLQAGAPLPRQFNLLFFGHFSELDRERFQREMARSLAADGSVYRTMVSDIHSLGSYLAHHKYRYLRLSYLSFLAGFVLATLIEIVQVIAH
jgi:hypothetical protein